MSGFTPGPWTVDVLSSGYVVRSKSVLPKFQQTRKRGTVAGIPDRPEAHADAHLISAAPDLLAVAKLLLTLMEKDAAANNAAHAEIFLDEPEVVELRAAIARATGAAS